MTQLMVESPLKNANQMLEQASEQLTRTLQRQQLEEQQILQRISEEIQKAIEQLPTELQDIEIQIENGFTMKNAFSASRAWMINFVLTGEVFSILEIIGTFKMLTDKKADDFMSKKDAVKEFKQSLISLENNLENAHFNFNIKHKIVINKNTVHAKSKIVKGKNLEVLF